MAKKGDTLIEVTIAIGIFSMIAIAVASVMSSGTSGSQMALETTLTREEIDAQADALRFIHSSYVSSKRYEDSQNAHEDSQNQYRKIWGQIIDQAIQPSDENNDVFANIENFSPSTCDALYYKDDITPADSLFSQKAFILNLKDLSNPDNAVFVANNPDHEALFVPTLTYPRVIFGTSDNNSDEQSLIDNASFDSIYQAAGIYIVAVQDPGTTNFSGNNTSAFFDFYIRTCWYGTDANRPSTISTVVRLYDPEINANS